MKYVNKFKYAVAVTALMATVPAMAGRSAESIPSKGSQPLLVNLTSTSSSNGSINSLSGNGKAWGHVWEKGKGHDKGNGKGHEKYDSPG